jgi:hypothetical protein
MPDIDVDFTADRREEVIRYVYQRYREEHVGMVCNVVTYRARSALRDAAKALAFPPDVVDRAAKTLDTRSTHKQQKNSPQTPRPPLSPGRFYPSCCGRWTASPGTSPSTWAGCSSPPRHWLIGGCC